MPSPDCMTSSVLVVNFDETKFECAIDSKVEAMEPMIIQKIKFYPKSGMSFFREYPRHVG